jgi:hypothetical protein
MLSQDAVRSLRHLTIAATAAYGPMIFINAYCMTGWGGWAIPGSELFVLVPLTAIGFAIVALPLVLISRVRRPAIYILVVSVAMVILFVVAVVISSHLRTLGFYFASQRAEPLIAGVEHYIRDHGRPPNHLNELVPRYLPKRPERIPDLEIIVGATAREQYGGNEWALSALVSTGMINWDLFIYYPNQQYPESGHGGGIERIGRWAYVHE